MLSPKSASINITLATRTRASRRHCCCRPAAKRRSGEMPLTRSRSTHRGVLTHRRHPLNCRTLLEVLRLRHTRSAPAPAMTSSCPSRAISSRLTHAPRPCTLMLVGALLVSWPVAPDAPPLASLTLPNILTPDPHKAPPPQNAASSSPPLLLPLNEFLDYLAHMHAIETRALPLPPVIKVSCWSTFPFSEHKCPRVRRPRCTQAAPNPQPRLSARAPRPVTETTMNAETGATQIRRCRSLSLSL